MSGSGSIQVHFPQASQGAHRLQAEIVATSASLAESPPAGPVVDTVEPAVAGTSSGVKIPPGLVNLLRPASRILQLKVPTDIPRMTKEKADYLESILQPGDIVLTTDDVYPLLQAGTKAALGSNYTHSLVYEGKRKFIEVSVGGLGGEGVIRTDLDWRIGKRMLFQVIRPPYQTEQDREAMLRYCRAELGKPYDYTFDWNSKKGHYCTELLVKGLKSCPHPIDVPLITMAGRVGAGLDQFKDVPGARIVYSDHSDFWKNVAHRYPALVGAAAVTAAVAASAGAKYTPLGAAVGTVVSIAAGHEYMKWVDDQWERDNLGEQPAPAQALPRSHALADEPSTADAQDAPASHPLDEEGPRAVAGERMPGAFPEDEEPSRSETLTRSETPSRSETLTRSEEPSRSETLTRPETPSRSETLTRSETPSQGPAPARCQAPAQAEPEPLPPFMQFQKRADILGETPDGRLKMRNIRWGVSVEPSGSYHGDFHDTVIDPSQVKQVYFVLEPFPPERVAAHALLYFDCGSDVGVRSDDGRQSHGYVVSVEVRLREGEKFDMKKGVQNHFPMIYLVGTWEDTVQKAAAVKNHRLVRYRLDLTDEQKHDLARHALVEAARNRDDERYHTVLNNCNLGALRLVNAALPEARKLPEKFLGTPVEHPGAWVPVLVPAHLDRHELLAGVPRVVTKPVPRETGPVDEGGGRALEQPPARTPDGVEAPALERDNYYSWPWKALSTTVGAAAGAAAAQLMQQPAVGAVVCVGLGAMAGLKVGQVAERADTYAEEPAEVWLDPRNRRAVGADESTSIEAPGADAS